jgi:hypothetical protein
VAASFVQRTNGAGGGTASTALAFAAGIAAGSFIVVAGSFQSSATGVTCTTDKGDVGIVALPPTANADSSKYFFCQMFPNPGVGAKTITATYVGTPTETDLVIWEIAGLALPAIIDRVTRGAGSGTAADSGATGVLNSADEAAVAFGITKGNFSAAGSGWSNAQIVSATGAMGEERVAASTASFNGTGTTSSAAWSMLVATFRASLRVVPKRGGSPALKRVLFRRRIRR